MNDLQKELTPRQRQILDYILQHIHTHGYPPTVREIGEAVNLSSSSTVHAHLKNLEDSGMIQRDRVLTRAIKVVAGSNAASNARFKPSKVISLPIVGTVAAGKPTLAVEDIEDVYPVPQEFLSGADGFILKVRGDSMIDDGIHQGDYVIVRRQPAADEGDTIVAMVDGEATVKRFYREDGKVRLQPANRELSPMFYPSVDIVGKVVGLVRKMG